MSKTQTVQIRNRFSGEVIFTTEIDTTSPTKKIVAAVKLALEVDANLRYANLRYANLSGANLRYADLSGANLRYADLSGANLRYADLSGADLSGADLRDADLRCTNLRDADLTDADLRYANLRYADRVPIINDIHLTVYNAAKREGALNMGFWHYDDFCGTTHCRAGWVVHLAGEGGRALEDAMGTPAAAALIYQASDPSLDRIPDFYASNEDALADMKRLAEAEQAAAS